MLIEPAGKIIMYDQLTRDADDDNNVREHGPINFLLTTANLQQFTETRIQKNTDDKNSNNYEIDEDNDDDNDDGNDGDSDNDENFI